MQVFDGKPFTYTVKTLVTLIVIPACCILFVTQCERDRSTSRRIEDAARQAKEEAARSTNAAIEEAKRISAETGEHVDVKVTHRVDVNGVPVPPPPPPASVVPPPPTVEIERVEPERTPGQAIDNALQKVGRKLQEVGERIEDRTDR